MKGDRSISFRRELVIVTLTVFAGVAPIFVRSRAEIIASAISVRFVRFFKNLYYCLRPRFIHKPIVKKLVPLTLAERDRFFSFETLPMAVDPFPLIFGRLEVGRLEARV